MVQEKGGAAAGVRLRPPWKCFTYWRSGKPVSQVTEEPTPTRLTEPYATSPELLVANTPDRQARQSLIVGVWIAVSDAL